MRIRKTKWPFIHRVRAVVPRSVSRLRKRYKLLRREYSFLPLVVQKQWPHTHLHPERRWLGSALAAASGRLVRLLNQCSYASNAPAKPMFLNILCNAVSAMSTLRLSALH